MPLRVRRKLSLLVLAAFAVLTTAAAAAASNGGFAPLDPASPNAHRTTTAYYYVLAFTSAVFVLVEGTLIAFIVKYRSRGRARTVEGAQVHGHTRLELMWTLGPVAIVAAIAGFVFYELPGISNAPAAANPLRVTVEAHQFYWQFDYPNGSRSIDELHVPVDQVVDLTVRSYDVVHSWWIPELGGKIQAIPGRTNHFWFRAEKAGIYGGQCAEFCGIFHEAMLARVIAEPENVFDAFVSTRAKAQLGRAEFEGVCSKCHGLGGVGDYGPNLTTNPALTQASTLTDVVRNGRGRMPPVGDSWTPEQFKALITYAKAHVYKGATTSGG
jgi:cytochrome c oxidase subunit II